MTPQQDPNLEFLLSDAQLNLSAAPEMLLSSIEVQTEQLGQRQRQISAKVQIPHSVEQVWQVLTDYEALPEFIPNLAHSRLLKHPTTTDGIRLEQVGTQRLLKFNFSARVVLDLEEKFPQEITFNMVEGDFKAFSGNWWLEPCSFANKIGTNLRYTVRVLPKLTMPISIIERRLRSDLQVNLSAINQRVRDLFAQDHAI